jgi:hypothetical protein
MFLHFAVCKFSPLTDKEMPDIPKEVFKEMPEITITENGVEKLLRNLNPNKHVVRTS